MRLRLSRAAEPTAPPFGRTSTRCSRARSARPTSSTSASRRSTCPTDMRSVQRQAFAGMLWSKQYYCYDGRALARGRSGRAAAAPARRAATATGGTSQRPTCSRCRTSGSTRGSPRGTWPSTRSPFAMIDPEFAKHQLDPAHARVVHAPQRPDPGVRVGLRRRQSAGARVGGAARLPDRADAARPRATATFLERVFHKLLLNFTWWVNRKDAEGSNIFQGGFLGLDNIGVFDRTRRCRPAATSSRPTARAGWRCTA